MLIYILQSRYLFQYSVTDGDDENRSSYRA